MNELPNSFRNSPYLGDVYTTLSQSQLRVNSQDEKFVKTIKQRKRSKKQFKDLQEKPE